MGVDSWLPRPASAADVVGCAVSEVVAAPGAGAPGPDAGVSVFGFSAPKTRSRPEALYAEPPCSSFLSSARRRASVWTSWSSF